MNYLSTTLFFVVITLLVSSCVKNPPVSCSNSPSDFQTLYQSMITNGHDDFQSFDTEIHEYTFTLSASREVCEIGYQSQPDMGTTPYQIEIFNNATNAIIYSDAHFFSITATSYVNPSTTIILQSGVSYTVRRIQTGWGGNIGNTIGRFASKSVMDFPYNNGIMTITSANFYQRGGPLPNKGIPYIDLNFF